MPRRIKRERSSRNNAPWLSTFADLMNLLLCFFVLLFSMSTIDAEKFEQISISLANTFGIFDGGHSSIGEGQLISSGMTQLNELDEYFSDMGKNNQDSETETPGDHDPTTQGPTTGEKTELGSDVEAAIERIQDEMAIISERMHDELSDYTEQANLGNFVEVSMDPEFQFVQLSLKGNVLFDSGKAEIKEEAKPVLSKVGDVLLRFQDFTFEIEGHTDNVPVSTTNSYKNNNWLSSARALNAAEYLIHEKGMNPKRVKYSGRGEYNPIESNATAKGREQNRRIEIKIYSELK